MNRPGVLARRATPADIDAVVHLCLQARGESLISAQVCSPSPDVVRQQLSAVFAIPDMRLLVVEIDDVVVGFALARTVLPGLFSETGWLQVEVLYVTESRRRRGAGHALMSALAHLALEEGAQRVVTMPLTGARSEQRFLARLGFAAAAAHRIVDTPALQRRLELDSVPPERRRSRGLDHLIATRRRTRAADVEDGARVTRRPAPTPAAGR